MKKTAFVILLCVGAMLAGCLSPTSVAPVSEESGSIVGLYKLRPLDPLVITLLGIPVEKQIESIIDEHGQITLPYINDPVDAAGLTTSGLERKIQSIYMDGGIYRNITVNIQTSAKTYYMEGEVARPMEYPLSRRITLLQAIAAAGGYTDYADKKDVTITRRGEIINLNAKTLEKNPELDIPIEAGDRIKVDRTFY